ncbi:hypothetical protein, partial [Streptomyces sp. Ru87]|uniref:hypothetical protein n=1 Tax=Streptomyces sp. Ru87 TaxID=2044307 RepID=UPI00211D7660
MDDQRQRVVHGVEHLDTGDARTAGGRVRAGLSSSGVGVRPGPRPAGRQALPRQPLLRASFRQLP